MNTLFYRFLATSYATVILAVGCAQKGAQSGNEAQKVKGPDTAPTPVDVSLGALDAEFGTFLRMNPGFILGISRLDRYSVADDNTLKVDRTRFRAEVFSLLSMPCPEQDNRQFGIGIGIGILKFRDQEGCFKKGTLVSSSELETKNVKRVSNDATREDDPVERGFFFRGKLVGVLGEFLCRDSEIGKEYQEVADDEKTPLSKSHSVVGCDLPQLKNGKISGGEVITLHPDQSLKGLK